MQLLQPDDYVVLRAFARYYVLRRAQVQTLCFPNHTSGRATRRRVQRLKDSGYLSRHSVPVAIPGSNGASPVFFVTKKGAEALATHFDDARFATTNTRSPRADRLAHWIAVNDTRIIVEQAVTQTDSVDLLGWISEHEIINKDEAKSQQFALHTQLSDNPPLSCSPDAAFVLSTQGFHKVFYLEQDRGTSSPKQVAARKTRGYAELARREGHRRHFPQTNVAKFSVLVVTSSNYRCTAIGDELKSRDRGDLWLLINQQELTAESFLHGDIVYNHKGESGPLIKPQNQDDPNQDDDPASEPEAGDDSSTD